MEYTIQSKDPILLPYNRKKNCIKNTMQVPLLYYTLYCCTLSHGSVSLINIYTEYSHFFLKPNVKSFMTLTRQMYITHIHTVETWKSHLYMCGISIHVYKRMRVLNKRLHVHTQINIFCRHSMAMMVWI